MIGEIKQNKRKWLMIGEIKQKEMVNDWWNKTKGDG
jgi:hypothetical protein